ncbi:MAG: glycosyl hydrolase, family 76 [Actinomycetia bacterium]|nr:glycosyl hydrolase, family 76 [Actinomycetes bacterium]
MPLVRRIAPIVLLAVVAGLGVSPPAVAATGSLAAGCNKFCDGRDPASADSDRTALTTAYAGRQVSLHFSDGDAMGWAAVSAGSAGDQLWLDRSFDGGRTWGSGWLGQTKIPAGQKGWRTLMFNVDDWAARGVGALRACVQPSGQTGIGCTTWARTTWNAYDRRTAAATGLMQFYNYSTGLFSTTNWWNSANGLTAIIDNIRVSGMTGYQYAISNTYDKNKAARKGDFRSEFMDDTGWWGLAWVDAYDLTKDSRYLTTARADADFIAGYWDGVCGGGVWGKDSKNAKNSISNALYIQLTAALHNRIPGDTTYLQRAKAAWTWYRTKLVTSSNMITDGIDMATCANGTGSIWTYNQGVILSALAELSKATGDATLLTTARQLANTSTTSGYIHSGGILRDWCEPDGCAGNPGDSPSFKGPYVRGVGTLNRLLTDHPYTAYLDKQADTAYAKSRTSLSHYGLSWAGPFDTADAARQHSALDLMNAAP